jgi:hypothetical protein
VIVVVAIVALVVAAFALLLAWGVALRLRDVDRVAASICVDLHDRLQEAEAAVAAHVRHDAFVKAAVTSAALAHVTRH